MEKRQDKPCYTWKFWCWQIKFYQRHKGVNILYNFKSLDEWLCIAPKKIVFFYTWETVQYLYMHVGFPKVIKKFSEGPQGGFLFPFPSRNFV
jgi:hypothetical protein